MNGHIPETRLNDYVDGLLPAADAAEVRRHLAACIECEREVVGLRELLGQLRTLPARIEPPRDLRPAIAAAVAGRAVRPRALPLRRALRAAAGARYPLAAAAVLLVAATIVVTRWATRAPAGDVVASSAPATASPARAPAPFTPLEEDGVVQPAATAAGPMAQQAEFRRAERRYVTQIRELQHDLDRQRERLAPQTVQILERNLAVIDRAIAESRAALERDPTNRLLSRLILSAYEQKVELLRRANALAS